MGALQPMHLIVILVVVLIIFGPGKLTELGGQLGKGVKEFRQISEGTTPTPTGRAFCDQCGGATVAGSTFCSHCGHAIGAREKSASS